MIITSAVSKSYKFPEEGFQRWDVITPKDEYHYGELYTVVDYRQCTHSDGKIEYFYILVPHFCFEETFKYNLNGYEKLYSRRKEMILNVMSNFKNKLNDIIRSKDDIDEDLGIDTTLLDEGIDKIELFCKKLENMK